MYRKRLETSLTEYYRDSPKQGVTPEKLEDTVKICAAIVRQQSRMLEEARTGFWQYLSDIFRFEGLFIFGLQAVTLLFVCLIVSTLTGKPSDIPILMPLFVLALFPVLLRAHYYKVSEIEAATRASGAQIILAKLVLAGGANLLGITVFLWFKTALLHSVAGLGELILYAFVPYLICMVSLLRGIRLQKIGALSACTLEICGFCFCWGVVGKTLPVLYETSMTGVWILLFFVFGAFFLKEILYILEMRKEGKMYGIIL